jgi:hypothetical protein
VEVKNSGDDGGWWLMAAATATVKPVSEGEKYWVWILLG